MFGRGGCGSFEELKRPMVVSLEDRISGDLHSLRFR